MTVLVVAPHPDDESIGCGGTVALHASRGERVMVAFLTSGELGLKHLAREEAWRVREREAEAACGVLGVAQLAFLRRPDWFLGDDADGAARALRPILERDAPHTIYVPHPGEWHPDHQAALPILRDAVLYVDTLAPIVRLYEVWTPHAQCDHLEDVTAVMDQKLRAVRCHRSQLESHRYDRAVEGLNAYRGALGALGARCEYAEAFAAGVLEKG